MLSQDEGQRKWYQMVEVNGAYKHGRYEKLWPASQMDEHDFLHWWIKKQRR